MKLNLQRTNALTGIVGNIGHQNEENLNGGIYLDKQQNCILETLDNMLLREFMDVVAAGWWRSS